MERDSGSRVAVLLGALTRAHLKASVRGAALHYIWWLLDPLLMMAIYIFVVAVVLQRGGDRYPLFLFCALLPWKAISNSASHCVQVMRNSRPVLTRVAFPRAALPLSQVCAQMVYMVSGFIILVPLLLYYRCQPSLWWLCLPLLLVLQAALTAGLCLALSIFGAWFKDAENFVSFLLQLWFFGSPAIYSLEQVPEDLRRALVFNPLTGLFAAYRAVLMDGGPPPAGPLGIAVAITALLLVFGALLFRRCEGQLAKVV